jgi:hypothetical protein
MYGPGQVDVEDGKVIGWTGVDRMVSVVTSHERVDQEVVQ